MNILIVSPSIELFLIFLFLSGDLTNGQLRQICNQQTQNMRSSDKGHIGPMLDKTRHLLDTFYEPFNKDLADILKNDGFLWR